MAEYHVKFDTKKVYDDLIIINLYLAAKPYVLTADVLRFYIPDL